MSEPSRRICKIVLRIFSQLLWLAALVIALSGIFLLINFKHYRLFFEDEYIILPALLAVIAALFLLAAGIAGCCASEKESPCLQGIMGSELAPFERVFHQYNGSSKDPDTQAVDFLQKELHCCGLHGFQDWQTSPWFNESGHTRVPLSCCNSTFTNCTGSVDQLGLLFTKGCQGKLENVLSFILHLILWSSVGAAGIQVVGLVSVSVLMRESPLQEYRILDRDPFS
ncbi:tetraspanin 37 isoform X2 [Polyodon spathula]|uniref:tetraspanin 37 isoform X2 n=1 Tax=Polyodon spathula TaxID=7913 RepID=UPI001B7E3C7B|nr:tetraspanin 37 isoform X2 [Polyodon spathula]